MIEKVLPQDDICHCGKRIGNHEKYDMWVCLQYSSNKLRKIQLLLLKCKSVVDRRLQEEDDK